MAAKCSNCSTPVSARTKVTRVTVPKKTRDSVDQELLIPSILNYIFRHSGKVMSAEGANGFNGLCPSCCQIVFQLYTLHKQLESLTNLNSLINETFNLLGEACSLKKSRTAVTVLNMTYLSVVSGTATALPKPENMPATGAHKRKSTANPQEFQTSSNPNSEILILPESQIAKKLKITTSAETNPETVLITIEPKIEYYAPDESGMESDDDQQPEEYPCQKKCQNQRETGPRKCPQCDIVLIHEHGLLRHIKVVHERITTVSLTLLSSV